MVCTAMGVKDCTALPSARDRASDRAASSKGVPVACGLGSSRTQQGGFTTRAKTSRTTTVITATMVKTRLTIHPMKGGVEANRMGSSYVTYAGFCLAYQHVWPLASTLSPSYGMQLVNAVVSKGLFNTGQSVMMTSPPMSLQAVGQPLQPFKHTPSREHAVPDTRKSLFTGDVQDEVLESTASCHVIKSDGAYNTEYLNFVAVGCRAREGCSARSSAGGLLGTRQILTRSKETAARSCFGFHGAICLAPVGLLPGLATQRHAAVHCHDDDERDEGDGSQTVGRIAPVVNDFVFATLPCVHRERP